MSETQKIYPALIAVLKDISQDGIAKDRKNQQQGYQFRGVDDVMNAFAPLFAKHGLALIPSFSERHMEERSTKSGGALFVVTLKGMFKLFADDGSFVEVGPIYGEASDTADKATNKAMAVAFKIAMFQAFCVPLEGVTGGDADERTHEVAGRAKTSAPQMTPALRTALTELKAKREELQVSADDLLAYARERFGTDKPGEWTLEQVREAIHWLDLGAPSTKALEPAA